MPLPDELYRTDVFAWTQAQSRAVRAAAGARVNFGELQADGQERLGDVKYRTEQVMGDWWPH